MEIQISMSCRNWYDSDGSYEQDQRQAYNFQKDAQIFHQEMQGVELSNIRGILVSVDGVQVSFVNCNTKSYKCSQFSELVNILECANEATSKEVARISQYEDLAKYLSAAVTGYGVYATSYGVGVYALSSKTQSDIQRVEKVLDEMGVSYTNEYSEARWVYRFKISRSKKNIAILKKI